MISFFSVQNKYKMCIRFLCGALVVILCLAYASSKPQPSVIDQSGLTIEQKRQYRDLLVKFLEIPDVLGDGPVYENNLHRLKRELTNENEEDTETPKPGFFDRAAKFITELLQKFLKWVNSSDDKKK
ncbi:hypothetical protein FQR65_LT07592 [Abscondita terminalis]|nr:hypothetical protein FQR65_LT07592 [Abscondita terminalis]